MPQPRRAAPRLTRRLLLAGMGATAGAAAVAACGGSTERLITATSPQVAEAEAARRTDGEVVEATLTAQPVTADLAGIQAQTWAYQEQLAGPAIYARRGDALHITLDNRLPTPTSTHWHGIVIDNAADGVPPLTQAAVPPAGTFAYRFVVPDAGTYWYHSHVGLQLDRGLAGPLIITDPDDPPVDLDQPIMLDDWLDGVDGTPDDAFTLLRNDPAMGHMGSSGGMHPMARPTTGPLSTLPAATFALLPTTPITSPALGGDAGDLAYPIHLLNGRPSGDRPTYSVRPGGRVRLRLINAGSDTSYRLAVGGHRLTVTHTDGRPVVPTTVDTVLVGMGERYDVTFTATSGAWPVYAQAEGKVGGAAAVLRTTDVTSPAPASTVLPAGLHGQLLTYDQLRPAPSDVLPKRPIDRRYTVDLDGSMGGYRWSMGGDAGHLDVHEGERVRITMRNTTTMYHPMHLHGHTFALPGYAGTRKDTVIVKPGQVVAIDLDATNPGQWLYHCHNTYHLAARMKTTLSCVT